MPDPSPQPTLKQFPPHAFVAGYDPRPGDVYCAECHCLAEAPWHHMGGIPVEHAGNPVRDPSCATLTYESDRARAFRYAAESTTFEEWIEAISDDIPIPTGLRITNGQVAEIARFCWENMPPHSTIVGVDWGKGADWTAYRNAWGTHRRGEPCPAPAGKCLCSDDSVPEPRADSGQVV